VGVAGVPQPRCPVAMGRALHLDHSGREPGQHLRPGRTRLVVGKIDDANAFECLAHSDPPSKPIPVIFLVPRPCAAHRGAVRRSRRWAAYSPPSRPARIAARAVAECPGPLLPGPIPLAWPEPR